MNSKRIIVSIVVLIAVLGAWYCLQPHQRYHFSIPTQFSQRDIPLVNVHVQGREYLLKMDLGSKSALVLHRSILDGLDKTPHKPLVVRDASGMSYEARAYTIPCLEVGGLVNDRVVVKEVNSNYILNTTICEDANKSIEECIDSAGAIGGAVFSDKNLLLDFDYSVVYVSNDRHELEKLGYDWKEFVKIPYELGRHCVILKFNTDFGEARLALDTGCTVSFLRSSFVGGGEPQGCKYGLPFVTSSKFEFGGKDFGPMNLYLYNISSELTELDGMLGMDFLIDHVVYIDREHKLVYVQDIATLSN